MPEINQVCSAERSDSCHELEARTPSSPEMEGRLLVAIEKKNHTFHVDGYSLSGTTKEEMAGLKKRRFAKLGAWELIAAYLLCRRPYIAIGTLGVGLILYLNTDDWVLTKDVANE